MQRSGTQAYADPQEFHASLPDPNGALVFTGAGTFKAQRTWINLKHLRLLQVEEALPRIAFFSMPTDRIHVFFPSYPTLGGLSSGVLPAGEIVLHGRGLGVHDRTIGPNCWGLISIEPRALATHLKRVAAAHIAFPKITQIVMPTGSAATRFVKLHRKTCRLARKKSALLHNEVVRTLENELLDALCDCLFAKDSAPSNLSTKAKQIKAMSDFEAAIVAEIVRPVSLPDICQIVGIAERTLRSYCASRLGMSPSRYLRLRRLNLVRQALQRSDTVTTVEAVARHYQFLEQGRFAGFYREIFGELPSATLGQSRLKST